MHIDIPSLVDYLAALEAPFSAITWNDWQISPVPSGNNLLFRATNPHHDVVVKFLIRDERQRAEREWDALTLLERLDLSLGPKPLYCDLRRTPHAVVVQTWLSGESVASSPMDDATWLLILEAYVRLHQVRRADVERQGVTFPQRAVLWPPEQAAASLREFAQRVPPSPYTGELERLLQRVEQTRWPNLASTECWCHGDANIRNLVRTTQGVQMVDWEYTGYNDPASEIASLMTHPFAQPTSDERWHWVAEQYANRTEQADMPQRIEVQYALRLAWWCIRLLIGHYVLLQQPSHRLVGPGAEAEISTVANIEAYFARARVWLAR